MNALTLQEDGEGWRLRLNGDWSLASIGKIDRELEALPGSMLGILICDWSRAERPGIAPVWLLLTRMNALTLQEDGEGWRLRLNGDWSLASIGKIDRELEALPVSMLGILICDWSRAERPGIAPVWLLLTR